MPVKLKLSGNKVVIPIDPATGEADYRQEYIQRLERRVNKLEIALTSAIATLKEAFE